MVALTSLNLSRNALKEKVLFYSKFYFENQMWWVKRYARNGCTVWIEKPITRDHSLTSLGKPCDADQWPLWQIFLSTPYTHERYLRSHLRTYTYSHVLTYWDNMWWFKVVNITVFFAGAIVDVSAVRQESGDKQKLLLH